jgi:hypothetical protein
VSASSRKLLVATLISSAAMFSSSVRADPASGTISYQSKSGPIVVTVRNVYLLRGPDEVSGRIIRRLVFSSAEMSAKIGACAAMSCSDADLGEGMTIDFDVGPRLNYWFVANAQRVQYSGSVKPEAAKLAADTPQRLAGTLTLDDSAVGGASVSIDFDANLLKEFAKPR